MDWALSISTLEGEGAKRLEALAWAALSVESGVDWLEARGGVYKGC